jgi:hypothetical protein
MKTNFIVVLGIALLAAHPVAAQFWSVAAHRIPAVVMGQSILRVDYFDSEFGDYRDYSRYPASIDIRTAGGRYVTSVRTDVQGRFVVRLQPGEYILKQRPTSISRTAHPLRINVRSAKLVSVIIISSTDGFSGGSSSGSSGGFYGGGLPPPLALQSDAHSQ